MADTKKIGEFALAREKQAELTDDPDERDRLYAEAAAARAELSAENASPVADNSAYNNGRTYYDEEGSRTS